MSDRRNRKRQQHAEIVINGIKLKVLRAEEITLNNGVEEIPVIKLFTLFKFPRLPDEVRIELPAMGDGQAIVGRFYQAEMGDGKYRYYYQIIEII